MHHYCGNNIFMSTSLSSSNSPFFLIKHFLAHAAAGGLSPTQISDGMEEVLGTSGLDTVAPKEAHPLCELERSLRIQRMATPVPVEMEQPLAFSGGNGDGDGDREDEEDAKEDEEAPYEEPEDPFPGMSGRRRPTEEEMDPNYDEVGL
jgi:hypothetical protein